MVSPLLSRLHTPLHTASVDRTFDKLLTKCRKNDLKESYYSRLSRLVHVLDRHLVLGQLLAALREDFQLDRLVPQDFPGLAPPLAPPQGGGRGLRALGGRRVNSSPF